MLYYSWAWKSHSQGASRAQAEAEQCVHYTHPLIGGCAAQFLLITINTKIQFQKQHITLIYVARKKDILSSRRQ